MHIFDGLLPLSQSLIYLSIAAIMVMISVWQSKNSLTLKQIPIVGVLGAGLFAAQMFNLTIPFLGVSVHLIGTALATVLLGPWVAILILSSILIIQSLFGDGGFLALGANTLNMAIIGAFTTFLIFLIIPKKWKEKKELFAVFAGISGFISTITMALAASIEFWIANVSSPALIFGGMLGYHALFGLIEGVATFALVLFIFKADASLFTLAEDSLYLRAKEEPLNQQPHYKFPVWATVTTVGIFGAISLFGLVASENPDGLEKTIEFIQSKGYDITALETGIFGFPDGLGWDVLQMFIIMTILFTIVLIIDFVVYAVKKHSYLKNKKSENSTNAILSLPEFCSEIE